MTDLLVKLIGTGIVFMLLFAFVGIASAMVEHQRASALMITSAWIGLSLSIVLVVGGTLGLIWL